MKKTAKSKIALSFTGKLRVWWHQFKAGILAYLFRVWGAGQGWSDAVGGPGRPDLNGVHVLDAAVAVAVGRGGLILKSTDGGLTWSPRPSGTNAELFDVHFVTATRGFAVGAADTLLRTDDAGETWADPRPALPSNEALTLRGVSFVTPDRGYVVGGAKVDPGPVHYFDGYVARTTDGGASWEFHEGPNRLPMMYSVRHVDDQVAVAVGGDHYAYDLSINAWSSSRMVLRTMNRGVDWQPVSPISDPTSTWVDPLVDVDAAHGWLAAVPFPGTPHYSHDGGATWTPGACIPSLSLFFTSVAILDADTAVAVGEDQSGALLYRTRNRGRTWNLVERSTYGSLLGVSSAGDALGIAVGSLGNRIRSTDAGATWAPASPSYSVVNRQSCLLDVVLFDADNGLALDYFRRVLATNDGGLTWTLRSRIEDWLDTMFFANPLLGIVAGRTLIRRTDDGGATWTELRTQDGGQTWSVSEAGTSGLQYPRGRFLDAANGLMRGDFQGTFLILRTTDGGLTWARLPIDVANFRAFQGYQITAARIVLCGSVGDRPSLLLSTDGGATWTVTYQVELGLQDFSKFHFVDDLNGWAAGRAIARTTDGGATWFEVDLPGRVEAFHAVSALEAWVTTGSTPFIIDASLSHIFHTTDGGLTWDEQLAPGFPLVDRDLCDICFIDPNRGLAVGRGTVLRTTTGGD